ncbi:MAG: Fpg/Nei family DNA glycosylase [Acidobacteria bacterium]|nr:Fpg/Nei family DNA glycosylase [Acidobacteriota bacterium]
MARSLPPEDAARLAGRDVVAVERRGKYQLLYLTGELVLVVHFRMAGDWYAGPAGDAPRHARAVLEFTDRTAVFLVDTRAFATLTVRDRGAEGLPALGPDAASPSLDGGTMARRLAGRRGPIKPVLLDQAVLAGLGNIYAAEALWGARISPYTTASALPIADLDRLVEAIRATIDVARHDPRRYSRGEALGRLAVYGRAGEPCVRCGVAVERAVQAGRSTYFCPGCQTDPTGPPEPARVVNPKLRGVRL